METAFTPDHYRTDFIPTKEMKSYKEFKTQSAEIPNLLSDLIRIERNNGYNKITGADYLLLFRTETNWRKCPISGMRGAGVENFYYSDTKIEGIKSLLVIKIIGDFDEVQIRCCRKFYPHKNPDWRAKLVRIIIDNWDTPSEPNALTAPTTPLTPTPFTGTLF